MGVHRPMVVFTGSQVSGMLAGSRRWRRRRECRLHWHGRASIVRDGARRLRSRRISAKRGAPAAPGVERRARRPRLPCSTPTRCDCRGDRGADVQAAFRAVAPGEGAYIRPHRLMLRCGDGARERQHPGAPQCVWLCDDDGSTRKGPRRSCTRWEAPTCGPLAVQSGRTRPRTRTTAGAGAAAVAAIGQPRCAVGSCGEARPPRCPAPRPRFAAAEAAAARAPPTGSGGDRRRAHAAGERVVGGKGDRSVGCSAREPPGCCRSRAPSPRRSMIWCARMHAPLPGARAQQAARTSARQSSLESLELATREDASADAGSTLAAWRCWRVAGTGRERTHRAPARPMAVRWAGQVQLAARRDRTRAARDRVRRSARRVRGETPQHLRTQMMIFGL